MKIVSEAFRKLKLADKFFIFLGIVSYFTWIYKSGYFTDSKIDDWCYAASGDHVTIFYYLAFALPFIPLLFRLIVRPTLFFFANHFPLLLVIGFCGVTAIAMLSSTGSSMRGLFNKASHYVKGEVSGFSVGGAKDIENFRKNILHKHLPSESDITYEGLYYDYYFDIKDENTGESAIKKDKPAIFAPTYSWASSIDPLSGTLESYMTVGLKSGMDFSKIKRKKLNLVIVLDISGSMSSPFDSYYYDRFSEKEKAQINAESDRGSSKMSIAARAVNTIIDKLGPEDSFGMVLFDNMAYLAKPLRKIESTNLTAIKSHILDIMPRGGTNMEAGYRAGRSLLKGKESSDPEEYENRIIFLTDAMPNTGMYDRDDLAGLAKEYSNNRIYTTFVGIGVDFQTELIEHMTKIKGANYYSVHSSWEFRKRMDREFDYIVNPLLFDLKLSFVSNSWNIDEVYGSPEADLATGELMRVNTLFPSPPSDEGVKGGVIVLKLKNTGGNGKISLTASYANRSGTVEKTAAEFVPPENKIPEAVEKDSKKAILLARYVKIMKEWLRGNRADGKSYEPPESMRANNLNYWEHQSKPLSVPISINEKLVRFREYFMAEAGKIGDKSLEREKNVMDALIDRGSREKK